MKMSLVDSQERSNELVVVGRGMVAEIDRLLAPTDRDFSAATHIDHVSLFVCFVLFCSFVVVVFFFY
jgi:hypothetical protein